MTSIMTKGARQRGQSIIEITLITPLLLIALYIPADFGIAFYTGNLVQNAAREGARIGSGLQKKDLDNEATVKKDVVDAVFNRLPSVLEPKSVSVTVKFYTDTSNPIKCMEFIEVTAQGDYKFFLYQLIGLFGGTVPDCIISGSKGCVTISRTTQIRNNYQPYTNIDYCMTPNTYKSPYSS